MLPTDPELAQTLRAHKGAICGLAFNANGKQLASGGADNAVMVWNFMPQMRAYKYLGHTVRGRAQQSNVVNDGVHQNSSSV
jgi:WD40 repeat protein